MEFNTLVPAAHDARGQSITPSALLIMDNGGFDFDYLSLNS